MQLTIGIKCVLFVLFRWPRPKIEDREARASAQQQQKTASAVCQPGSLQKGGNQNRD